MARLAFTLSAVNIFGQGQQNDPAVLVASKMLCTCRHLAETKNHFDLLITVCKVAQYEMRGKETDLISAAGCTSLKKPVLL